MFFVMLFNGLNIAKNSHFAISVVDSWAHFLTKTISLAPLFFSNALCAGPHLQDT